MASPSQSRSVSELIEVWQDWTTFIEQKKRSRRWTMDETLPEPGEDNTGERKSKKRGRYSDGHQHQILRSCMSFPEEMDTSFVHEERVRAASVDENNLSLMDTSYAQDVNTTNLSLGDAVNDSIIHIGCIDSDGNPLDMSEEHQQPVRRSTDASTESPGELKLYSSIDKVIDIARPMKLADEFQEQQYDELDIDMQEEDEASESAHKNGAKYGSQQLNQEDLVMNLDCSLQISEIDSADESDTPATGSPKSSQCIFDGETQEQTAELHIDSHVGTDGVTDSKLANQSNALLASSRDQPSFPQPDRHQTVKQTNNLGEEDSQQNYEATAVFGAPSDLSPVNGQSILREKKQLQSSNETNNTENKKSTGTFGGYVTRGGNPPPVTFEDEPRQLDIELQESLCSETPQQLPTSSLESQENKPPNESGPKSNALVSNHRRKRKKNTLHRVIVEQDAAYAFSPYRPVSSTLSSMSNVPITPESDSTSTTAVDHLKYSIQQPNDSILEQYLEKMKSANEYYADVKPFHMGNRNLPLNQVEVVLRRRAIKKPEKNHPAKMTNASVDGRTTQISNKNDSTVATGRGSSKTPVMNSHALRPSSREAPLGATRRTLFPNMPGHSRNHSLGMDTTFEDDSTISSATTASTWTTGNASAVVSVSNTSILHSTDTVTEESSQQQRILKEEVIGDTSLGLKLTILRGKVIVQAISPLEDGRASPAQLCGLFCPGDCLIAVNGSPLIDGSIHTPVPMDKMVLALKPLSEPIDGDGRYSREVRLRFVIGEGKKLLLEQKERELRKQRVIDERKKLGLDGKAGSASVDHAADIFGLSALMGVDQFTGMPMFQEHHLETHHDEEVVVESRVDSDSNEALLAETSIRASNENQTIQQSLFSKDPPQLQSRISHQLAIERQWVLQQNTSSYFTLDKSASLLLRPPSPPPIVESADCLFCRLDPAEARQKRLELGVANLSHAGELLSRVEKEEHGIDEHEYQDPMEVASRVCGTATVRTGASRRRWHRGDSVILEDTQSAAISTSSMDNQADANTLHSEESIEMCDHRLLVDLAANSNPWRLNVMKRLEDYAAATERASYNENTCSQSNSLSENVAPSGLDSFLFGGDVAKILSKKQNSLALPPGEMTQMLFDLIEHLENGLPIHVFTGEDAVPLNGSERAVTFIKPPRENDADASKATDFLLNDALVVWMKSFRPLPWKQRRALWPLQSSTAQTESSSMVSSQFDDGMSLSMASGGTHTTTKAEKRNLRQIIEELELDPETRRETCSLVTFYFTHKYRPCGHTTLPEGDEQKALDLIDEYGSYLDLYQAFILAGKMESESVVKKLVSLAKFDPQHREAMKGLQKAKVLLFYEQNMLSALHELLQTGAYCSLSANFDFVRLLVSAFPDLTPESVRASTSSNSSSDLYSEYLSLLMHPDEGSDAAKQDGSLVKEWCSMLCSSVTGNDEKSEESMKKFYQIASDDSRSLYNRDLPFLLDTSIKMSEYDLAIDIANELLSKKKTRDDYDITVIIQHLRHISETAIVNEVNHALLGHVITFYTALSKKKEIEEFDVVAELIEIFRQCVREGECNPTYDISSNLNKCLTTVAENASPSDGLKVLTALDLPLEEQTKVSVIRTLLTRGARENVGNDISRSLLRIQQIRAEQRRLEIEESMTVYNFDENDVAEDEEETDGFIWSSMLEGRMMLISK